MKFINKENGDSLVEVVEEDGYYGGRRRNHDYASKALAGTALGLGIGGVVLGLAKNNNGCNNGGLFGYNLFGNNGCNNGTPNIAIASTGMDRGANGVTLNDQYIERKECEDMMSITKGMYDLYIVGQTNRFNDRQVLNGELFGIYKSTRDGFDALNAKHNADAFSLYKYSRDSKDEVLAEIGNLKTELAVLKAVRPYQDAILQGDIKAAAEQANFNLFRRTCRMIEGDIVLPSTPTVTGFPSQRCCNQNTTATTPAA